MGLVKSKPSVFKWRVQAWVLKKSVPLSAFGGLNPAVDLVGTALTGTYAVAGTSGVVGRERNRTRRLMFWAVAARKNCSRTNFNLRRRRRRRPM